MELLSTLTIDKPPQEVFPTLVDLDAVALCIPGAELGPSDAHGARTAAIAVRLGPMRFEYQGTVEIVSVDDHARVAVLDARADEVRGEGSASARISMSVADADVGSLVEIRTALRLSGSVAQLGSGMIGDVAEAMIEDFGDALRTKLGGAPQAPGDPSHSPPRDRPPGPGLGGGASIDGWKLLRRAGRRRVVRAERMLRSMLAEMSTNRGRRAGREVDFIVVGSGSGGLMAALVAHDAGLRVVIYEKDRVVGGGTAYSGGVVWAPCNHIMRRKGIEDSVADAMTYLTAASEGRGDTAIQRRYVESVGGVIERVEALTGLKWVIWGGQPDYYTDLPGARTNGRAILPHPDAADVLLSPQEEKLPQLSVVRSTPHMDFVPGFQTSGRRPRDSWLAGRSIIGGLWLAVLKRRIEYHVSTPVVSLTTARGAVTGVEVRNLNGRLETIRARAGVLLNTGGFDWNQQLAARHLPGPRVFPQTPPSNTGDGHLMGIGLGASTALMDKAIWHPSILIPGDVHDGGAPLYRMFNLELSKPHCVVVNAAGRRFATEAAYYALADAFAVVDQRTRLNPNLPAYFIGDETYRERYGLPGVRPGEEPPSWIATAPSLSSLAEMLEIDPAALNEEIARFNAGCAEGVDRSFGRGTTTYERYWGDPEVGPNPTMGPVERPPFYGFPVHLAHAGSRGGLVTTPDGEVVRADGSVIEGLYACGNTAANLLFGGGYASGSAVGSSLVFGCLAAERVAQKARGNHVGSTKGAAWSTRS